MIRPLVHSVEGAVEYDDDGNPIPVVTFTFKPQRRRGRIERFRVSREAAEDFGLELIRKADAAYGLAKILPPRRRKGK